MGLVPYDCTTLHAHLLQTMNVLQISSAYHEHTNYGVSLPTQISVFCPDYLSFGCWPGNNPTGTAPHIHTWNLQILSQKSNLLLLMLSLCLLECLSSGNLFHWFTRLFHRMWASHQRVREFMSWCSAMSSPSISSSEWPLHKTWDQQNN